MDRRGFFTSLGAALLAPVLPLKEKWTFNRSHAIAYQAMGTIKSLDTVPVLLSKGSIVRGNILPYPQLHQLNSEEFYLSEDDPFQTFIVDTNEVI